MPLTTGAETSLNGDGAIMAVLVEIVLPDKTLRLLDGPGVLTFGGQTFSGDDADYGSIADLGAVEDGQLSEAARWSVFLTPKGDAALALLLDPAVQNSAVTGWEVSIDPVTGQPVVEPDPMFVGFIDVPTLSFEDDGPQVELDCYGYLERFFAQNEGARLTSAHHQRSYPSDLGFDFIATDYNGVWGLSTFKGVTTKT
ncbi:MAG: hypothetical protein ACOYM5_02725 [Caulobacter sp.]